MDGRRLNCTNVVSFTEAMLSIGEPPASSCSWTVTYRSFTSSPFTFSLLPYNCVDIADLTRYSEHYNHLKELL